LDGLTADTRYFVKLVSVDLSGNNSIFNELDFKTANGALKRTNNEVLTINNVIM
jgi:hypothetical protein